MHRTILLLLLTGIAFAWDQNDELLTAARKGDLATVQSLIEKGADIEAKTSYGQTPLYLAAMSGHTAIVEFLLSKGAKTDIRDTFYKAGLVDFALQRKHYPVVQLLVEKGGLDVDKAFLGIAQSGSPELIKVALATAKVKPETMTKALEMALEQNKPAVADLLKSAGAKAPDPPFQVDSKILESYVGTYKTDALPLEIKVSLRDGKLVMQVTGQPEFLPKAKSATLFVFAMVGAEFEWDGANSFLLRQGGQKFTFKKVVAQ